MGPLNRKKDSQDVAPRRGRLSFFSRLIEDWDERQPAEPALRPRPPTFPPADLAESDREYFVSVEIAGADTADLAVQGFGNHLIVTGQRRRTGDFLEEKCLRRERSYGAFRRFIALPCGARVRPESITFEYRNGVLLVRLPK